MLAGNVAALLSPIIFSPVLTYVFCTQNYDYESMRSIRKVDNTDVAAAAHVDIELIPGEVDVHNAQAEEEEQRKLNKAALYSRTLTISMVICFLLLWPLPLYGTSYFGRPTQHEEPYIGLDSNLPEATTPLIWLGGMQYRKL